MKCVHCGAWLREDDCFCWQCGRPVQASPSTSPTGTPGSARPTELPDEGAVPGSTLPEKEAPKSSVSDVDATWTAGTGDAAAEEGMATHGEVPINESWVYHPHRVNCQEPSPLGEGEPDFLSRKGKENPRVETVPSSSTADQTKAALGPRAVLEEKEEFVWHGRRSLLEFIAQWCMVAVSWILGFLVLIFRVSLADAISAFFKTSQPLCYTIWGWIALALLLIGFLIVLMIFYFVLGSYYRLTTQRFIRQRGFIARNIDYVELMRVRDMGVNQTFLDRVFDVGDLQILSSERLAPDVKVNGIRHPYRMLEEIRRRVIHSRAVRGVGILEVDK